MKMEIIGPLLLSCLSGLSTMIGSLVILLNIKKVGEVICYSLSLSMSMMIIISIFELIPSSIKTLVCYYNLLYGIIISILVILFGYQTVYFINKRIKTDNNLLRIGLLNMICLIIHNFPEGIAVFISSYKNIKLGFKLCISIMMHNIPEGMIISIPTYYGSGSRGRAIYQTFLSSIAEVLGALLSLLFLKNLINDTLIAYILLFVAGLMISISINDIFKEILKYNNKKYIYLGIITSIIISLIIL